MTARFIGVVTVARSDYGIYEPVLAELAENAGLSYGLYVGGAHLVKEFGSTIEDIRRDRHPIAATVEMLEDSDTPEGMARSLARGVEGFSAAFRKRRPDILLVLGDRFEMLAAALAAACNHVPIAHIHGGEISEGALDDTFRHCLTKLAHLHFVATGTAAVRVRAMGEDPATVFVTGAPGLDNTRRVQRLARGELARRYGIPEEGPFLLVTYHPVTLEPGLAGQQLGALFEALDRLGVPAVFSLANADPEGRLINEKIRGYVDANEAAYLVENFGVEGYFSAMAHASAMVGNSSSGIIEAASFELPVVNVGSRQAGRERSANVLDVECSAAAIEAATRRAMSADFRAGLKGMKNVYGDGQAAPRIAARLREAPPAERLLRKRFHVGGGS